MLTHLINHHTYAATSAHQALSLSSSQLKCHFSVCAHLLSHVWFFVAISSFSGSSRPRVESASLVSPALASGFLGNLLPRLGHIPPLYGPREPCIYPSKLWFNSESCVWLFLLMRAEDISNCSLLWSLVPGIVLYKVNGQSKPMNQWAFLNRIK